MNKCLVLLLLLFTLLYCSGCKTIECVQVKTEYVHDSIYITKTVKDSILISDTIMQKGDTIYKTHYKYVYNTLVDTVYRDNVIYKDREKVVTEEKKVIPKWVWIVSGISGIIILIFVAYIIIKLYRRFHI